MKKRKAGAPRVAFIHPDLGIGGAERLVVDAAVELAGLGYEICIFTSRHDPARCFAETLDGRFEIRVRGRLVPPSIRNRLRAPCSLARMVLLSTAMRLERFRPDVVFCDLVPHVLPLLKSLTDAPVVFYCHYPDLLLTSGRRGLYRGYRLVFDSLEAASMRFADLVLVNSRFTADVFRQTFPHLESMRPRVVYPGVPVEQFSGEAGPAAGKPVLTQDSGDDILILSLNRFDPRKNLGLAIESLAALKALVPAEIFARVKLVIAGGYDEDLPESRKAFQDLEALAARLSMSHKVQFMRSVRDDERVRLLRACRCLLYTSPDEHFGIGVVEAMAAGRPVLAVNRGGPLETVIDAMTGFLAEPRPDAFARALSHLVTDPEAANRMGEAGYQRALETFSRRAFGQRLEEIFRSTL